MHKDGTFHFSTPRLKVGKTFKDFYKNIMSSPAESVVKVASFSHGPLLFMTRRPSQVTLLGPSQVPRSSRGALGLESTLRRELNSDLSPTGTLGPYLSSFRKMLRKWSQSSRSGWRQQSVSKVNQVFKHVRLLMEMENLILGPSDCVLGSNRHNQGAPQSLP